MSGNRNVKVTIKNGCHYYTHSNDSSGSDTLTRPYQPEPQQSSGDSYNAPQGPVVRGGHAPQVQVGAGAPSGTGGLVLDARHGTPAPKTKRERRKLAKRMRAEAEASMAAVAAAAPAEAVGDGVAASPQREEEEEDEEEKEVDEVVEASTAAVASHEKIVDDGVTASPERVEEQVVEEVRHASCGNATAQDFVELHQPFCGALASPRRKASFDERNKFSSGSSNRKDVDPKCPVELQLSERAVCNTGCARRSVGETPRCDVSSEEPTDEPRKDSSEVLDEGETVLPSMEHLSEPRKGIGSSASSSSPTETPKPPKSLDRKR